jgi:plasmid stabilization system protein ParE
VPVKRQILVRQSPEKDLLEAQRWYEERQPGLGGEFLTAIDGLLKRIVRNPLAYPVVYRETRRAVVRRFPFLLYFRVAADAVIVLACLHARRSPAVAKSRLLASERPDT